MHAGSAGAARGAQAVRKGSAAAAGWRLPKHRTVVTPWVVRPAAVQGASSTPDRASLDNPADQRRRPLKLPDRPRGPTPSGAEARFSLFHGYALVSHLLIASLTRGRRALALRAAHAACRGRAIGPLCGADTLYAIGKAPTSRP